MDQQQQQQVNEAAEKFAEAVRESYQTVADRAVSAQQLNAELTQNFFNSVINNLRAQAESYRALTDAMTSSMEALERTLKSQEETNRALKESLDAYRNVVESASETQERNLELAENFFGSLVETLRDQLESSRSLLLEPAARQQEFFQNVTQEWIDAYVRLLNAPLEFYRAGTQGTGDEGGGR